MALLSVVVPALNAQRFLPSLLNCLRQEQDPRVEYLFIDGGSRDHTMFTVRRQADLFKIIVSEKDQGQSDAINKGLRQAEGEYLTWLNADDQWVPGSLSNMLNFIELQRAAWYAANMIYIDEHSQIVRCTRTGGFEELGLKMGVLNVFGPATIWHRSLLEEVGYLDESFHYSMDTEYWFRLAQAGYRYRRFPHYLWAFRLHQDSKTAATVTSRMEPETMTHERKRISELYRHPLFHQKLRPAALILMRLRRIFCGAYPLAYLHTLRWRGKSLDAFKP